MNAEKKKMATWKKVVGAIILFFIIMIIIGVCSSPNDKPSAPSPAKEPVKVGQTLKTDYFDITVSEAYISKKIDTGNEFLDVTAEPGNTFIIFKVTFKNTDTESKYLSEGEILVNYNGKDYTFDKAETIMAEGYGLFFDQINPLTSKTTILAYQIPEELKGNIYWRPGRADSKEQIFLGNIK